jgi:hypothetical protein
MVQMEAPALIAVAQARETRLPTPGRGVPVVEASAMVPECQSVGPRNTDTGKERQRNELGLGAAGEQV